HGASWNFIFWGAYHGTLLSVEKTAGPRRMARVPAWLAWPVTFLLVLVGWIFFRADSLSHAVAFMGRMVAWDSWPDTLRNPQLLWPDLITRRTTCALGLAAGASLLPDAVWRRRGWDDPLPASRRAALARVAIAAILLLLSSGALADASYNPFIYYRF
ncbi:MAG: rane-bound O-acyltransferase family protein, partial [Lacunisphaera sp.]|nr:rane-bound O-acyltransferase family protein [Lacunisphaera sp.]